MVYVSPLGKTKKGSYISPLTKPDLTTTEDLQQVAQRLGLSREVEEIINQKPKLSTLQRISAGLGSFNPAEAILTGKEKGLGAGLLEYPKGIIKGIGSAITGTNYQGERRYFKEVVQELGIENKIAQIGIGFLGDVFLDPTTYIGGAIVKGILKGVGVVGRTGLGVATKISPEMGGAIKISTEAFQDALGSAFKAGYKTTGGLTDKVISTMGKTAKAQAGLAESNLARLGTGVLTKEQNAEVFIRLAGGKRLEYTLREAGESVAEAGIKAKTKALEGATGIIKETIEAQAKRVAKFGQELAGDDFYRSYFPFIRKDKLTKFLNDTKGLKIGSQGYKKQFRNLLTNENLEQDVAKAFFTRESQVVTDKIIRNSLDDIVRDFGKPLTEFKNADEATRAGYSMLRTKGVFGEELGWISKWDKKFIDDMLSPEFKTIDMLAKATGFDAITGLFKRSVTGLFVPFHIRNYLSGIMQNYEVLGWRSLLPKNIAVGQKLAYNTIKGIKMAGKEGDILKPFAERFKFSSFYSTDFDNALNAGQSLAQYQKLLGGASLKTTIKTAGLSAESIPFKVGRAVGNYIELQQKATAYITAITMGKKIPEALKIAEKAGFDYRVLTKFESQILRRIVPFYSFTRKNIELQLKTLGENPQRINQIIRLVENIGERPSGEELENLPNYLKEGFTIKLPDSAEGLKQYLSSLGTPIEQFAQLFKPNTLLGVISTMNPLLKVPIELSIGKDSFRQKDLKDVYDAREYSFLPKSLKDALGIKEVEKLVYKKNQSGKLVKIGTRKVYVADPERLLIMRSLFTSRGVSYLDQIFDGDIEGFIKYMKLFTGLKPQQINIEITKALQDKEQKRALEDLIIKMSGEYARFESFYQKK